MWPMRSIRTELAVIGRDPCAVHLIHIPYGATCCTRGQGGIGSKRRRYAAFPDFLRLPCLDAISGHLVVASSQLGLGYFQIDRAVGNVDFDGVAFFHQGDRATFGRFRRGMANA